MHTDHIIVAVVVLCVLSVICAVMLFSYLANKYQQFQNQKFERMLSENSPYRKDRKVYKKPKSTNDFLSRDQKKEKQKQIELESGIKRYNPELEHDAPQAAHDSTSLANVEDTKIVGVAKPVGFWTKFVTKQKLGFMVAMGGLQNNQNANTYWRNYIKAQAASQGKDQSKGR